LIGVTDTVANKLAILLKQPNAMIGGILENTFSNELKHTDITVKGGMAVRERETADSTVCVMAVTALDASIPGKNYRCRFEIVKMGGYGISLGMASQDILHANVYKSTISWSQVGHGNYLNCGNGDTYSHSDVAVNCKSGTLTFAKDDVIELEFNTATMTLSFRCKGQQRTFAVAPLQKDDCYRFVAYLCRIQEAVKLI
jgi:hypothetical protein